MSLSVESRRVVYSGNGSTTVFAIPFSFQSNSSYVGAKLYTTATEVFTSWVITTNYTISGSNLTALVAPASGTKLIIYSLVPLSQGKDFADTSPFLPSSMEDGLDILAQQVQQIDEAVKRAAKFNIATSLSNIDMPATLTAGATLAVNAGATGFEWGSSSSSISADVAAAAASAAAASSSASAAASSASSASSSASAASTSASSAAASAVAAAASASVFSDGDKGDIVVSGSGTVWSFDTSVVTAAAKTVLDDASTSAMRTTLGVAVGTDVQAYDAELAAIAGLVSAADKGIQFTGSGTAATYDLTIAGKALLDDADATAQRVTLGVVIGTNVQAYDPELAALAGLTSAADKGIQFTGSGTAATYDLTTAGKALLDDANAAAQRATLGSTTVGDAVFIAANALAGQTALALVPGTNVQAFDAELSALAGLTSAADKVPYFTGSGTAAVTDLTSTARSLIDDTSTSAMRTTLGLAIGADVQAYDAQLSSLIRQNSQSAAYTTVLTDGGKHIFHPSADTTARNWTIDSDANVSYPIGTAITFVNQHSGGVITIKITSDTMRLAGSGTTGDRTLAADGIATALKIASTEWIISGTGLT